MVNELDSDLLTWLHFTRQGRLTETNDPVATSERCDKA